MVDPCMPITLVILKILIDLFSTVQVVSVVTLLTFICEVPKLNLSQDTNYRVRNFMVIISPSRKMLGWCLKLGHKHSFQVLSSSLFTVIQLLDVVYSELLTLLLIN